MNELSPARRRELRALAHHLDAVVSISSNGLSAGVLKEIEVALKAHELIKIRVFGDDRELRQHYLKTICEETGASPVQSIGKLLVIWREAPPQEAVAPRPAKPVSKRVAQLRAESGRSAATPAHKPRQARPAGKPVARNARRAPSTRKR